MTQHKKQVKKYRLDQLLTDKGIFPSREKAKLAIQSGDVLVNNSCIDKPGTQVSTHSEITIKQKLPYVSRGGLKLEAGIKEFNIQVKDKIALDIGSSTGGFTDCLLKNGAKKVYAVDVGYGQLALELRNDPRVTLMEKTNARYLSPSMFHEPPSFVTIDVSFISLEKILPVVSNLLSKDSIVIALIKPQFEAVPNLVKKGVVRDPEVHEQVINKIKETAQKNMLNTEGLIPSPILGPKGNKEFLLYMRKI